MTLPAPGSEIYADELLALVDRRLVRLIATASQALPDNVATTITFGAGSEVIDTHGLHNEAVNPSRVTFDKIGFYRVDVGAMFAAQATPVVSACWVRATIGGVVTNLATAGRYPGATQAFSLRASALVECTTIGDYVEMQMQQDSAGADDTNQSSQFTCTLEVAYMRGPL